MSSTLKGAINSLKTRIAAAYEAITAKGGTLPATQDSANLPTAIASIPSGGGKKLKVSSIIGHLSIDGANIDELNLEAVDTSALGDTLQNFGNLFYQCEHVKVFDMSTWTCKVSSMANMFRYAFRAEKIIFGPGIDTSQCTNFVRFGQFLARDSENDCEIDMRYIDTSAGTIDSYLFCQPRQTKIRVGQGFVKSVNIALTGLKHDALVQFLTDLPTITTSQIITMGTAKLNLLSAEEKQIATDKGWTLA